MGSCFSGRNIDERDPIFPWFHGLVIVRGRGVLSEGVIGLYGIGNNIYGYLTRAPRTVGPDDTCDIRIRKTASLKFDGRCSHDGSPCTRLVANRRHTLLNSVCIVACVLRRTDDACRLR